MEEKIYKKMYLYLFNTVTDVLKGYKDNPQVMCLLLEVAQIECERMYTEASGKKEGLLKRLFSLR